ncbi:hypothetical protein HPB49_020112 [Dermacentor silvarum]|uniref:Uncharacterized protein n=1 Tax=Dermacentor silvarum TaxID=543639 RepID=A0ACB8CH13_DERSI|nr:hypothetical protein HPB49_020112 [Dermacentor silvarum]
MKRNNTLKAALEASKEKIKSLADYQVLDAAKEAGFPENHCVLLKECVAAAKVTAKQGRRYTDDWLLLCLLLHIRTPSGYRFMRDNNILPLPCVRTIRKYISIVGMKCGFDADFFAALKEKLEPKPNFQKHGMLLFDEIQVRERKCVNSKTLTYTGLVDHGHGGNHAESSADTAGLANHALVFMFIPFGESYTQPVGVFASRGPTKGTVLSQLVLQAIILLENAGAIVDGIVCDGASTNRRMWTELGIDGKLGAKKNSFEHPMSDARKVYVFSDVPHLVKCVRNRLLKQRSLKVNGQWVHWSCYVAVYKEDCKNAGGLKVCPKVTHHHIYPSHMELMRVKLATQLFSRSMASALKYYTKVNILHTNTTAGTIAFTERMNDLFDAMNRRPPKEGLRIGCRDLECIENSLDWLDDWERDVRSGAISQDMFLTQSTAEGLRVTMLSMLEISEYLLNQCGFKYVLTGKLNQDPLERFFG